MSTGGLRVASAMASFKNLESRAWSCETLQQGLAHVVSNAVKMLEGDYSVLPDDDLELELRDTLPEFAVPFCRR